MEVRRTTAGLAAVAGLMAEQELAAETRRGGGGSLQDGGEAGSARQRGERRTGQARSRVPLILGAHLSTAWGSFCPSAAIDSDDGVLHGRYRY